MTKFLLFMPFVGNLCILLRQICGTAPDFADTLIITDLTG